MNHIKRDFDDRHPDWHEAILINMPCEVCHRAAKGPLPPFQEYEEGGRIFVECTCARCRRRCRVAVADIA